MRRFRLGHYASVAALLCLSWFAHGAAAAAQGNVGADAEPSAWADSRDEDLIVKLVTFGPGDEVFNYFGHNAMVVQDKAHGLARLYNFGMFHFGREMLPSYMKGRLTFWVAETPVRATFAHYIDSNRSVRVQELNLNAAQRRRVADELARAVLPENRDYLYDHFFDNCSTRLRDIIDRAVGGQFQQALQQPARMTFRQHVRRYDERDPLTDFGLVFWMNDLMEKPRRQWDELFLPEELEQQVAHGHYRDAQGNVQALVSHSYVVFEATRPASPARPNRGWPWALALGAAIGGLAWLTAQWWLRSHSLWARALLGLQHALFGLSFGLFGLLGALMWAFTEHTITYHNENELLANPLTLALFPLGIALACGTRRSWLLTRWTFYLLSAGALLLVLLKLLPSFDQDVSLPLAILLPAYLGGALAHRAIAQGATTPAPLVPDRNRAVSRA
jgi:hypothetical protein